MNNVCERCGVKTRLVGCLMVSGMMLLCGCLNYLPVSSGSSGRRYGDYYNSTKKIWQGPYIHDNDWFWLGDWGSLGQTIGSSGLFLLWYGVCVTAPIGFVVHQVEKVTLAPVVDTLYLPFDFWFRDDYLKVKGARDAEK